MVTSKISLIHGILQFGYMLAAVTAQEDCMVIQLHGAVIISITPPSAYYQPNMGETFCWSITLQLNSNANDLIRISITYLSLERNMNMCPDTFSITEVCDEMNTTLVAEICSCSGNCPIPVTRSGSPGCYLRILLKKGNNGMRDESRGFQVYFSLESDPLVPNAPFSTTTNAATSSKSSSHVTSSKSSSHDSLVPNAPFSTTTNAATSSKSFSHDTDSLVPNAPFSTTNAATSSKSSSHESVSLFSNTPSSTTNAPNFSKFLKGKRTGPGAKVLVPVLVILIMILVVALTVAYFIRYYRRGKSDDKVASNTTFNNAAYSQNDVITSESHVESQLSDRNVRTETVNENPEISNKQGQVDNAAYQSVDEANQNPHEYTYIDLEGKQEELKNANQGQTSQVTNVTDRNASSNPVKPPDESKYYYIEPRIH